MPFIPGKDYTTSYTFKLPIGANSLNLVLGVDPVYVHAHQSTVELKTVQIEVLN
jgi:hypothetical protein